MAAPTRPRLKKGETPQSASYQKRLSTYNRAVALAEATKAQAEQNKREAKTRSKRDVLSEVSSKPGKKSAASTEKTAARKPSTLIESVRNAINPNRIDSALAAIEGGIDDADKDSKRKK